LIRQWPILVDDSIHLSLGKLEGIHDHPLQISRDNASYQRSSSDEIGRLECLFGFVSLSLMPLSQCQEQR
jgi:hypothetical protein